MRWLNWLIQEIQCIYRLSLDWTRHSEIWCFKSYLRKNRTCRIVYHQVSLSCRLPYYQTLYSTNPHSIPHIFCFDLRVLHIVGFKIHGKTLQIDMLVVRLKPASSSSLSSVLSPSVALCKMMASAHFKSLMTAFETSNLSSKWSWLFLKTG